MHRASMLSVHRSRLLVAGRAGPDEEDIRFCSVLLASVVSLMLICGVLSLVSSASGHGAFPAQVYVTVAPTAIMLVLVFLGWLVAKGIRALAASPQAPAAATPARQLARRLCACGLSDAAGVAALPAFPFQQPAQPVASAAASEGEPQAPRVSGVLCAVCLEDVRTGEMVRQLPACRHVFHVDCVDVWLHSHRTCPLCRCGSRLHSHRTCPLCRCELPRRKATAPQTAAVTPAMPEAVPLPPV